MIVREQQGVNLLLFSSRHRKTLVKPKPSGLPDSNVIFFVATKPTGSILESEAKESLLLAEGYVVFGAAATVIQRIHLRNLLRVPHR